jgi:hypothetical protein
LGSLPGHSFIELPELVVYKTEKGGIVQPVRLRQPPSPQRSTPNIPGLYTYPAQNNVSKEQKAQDNVKKERKAQIS